MPARRRSPFVNDNRSSLPTVAGLLLAIQSAKCRKELGLRMTKLLLSTDNPNGWKLEDIIDEIQNDIVRRSARIVDDGRPEARTVLTNNIEILKLLTVCSEKALDSTRVLSTLGPSQGPQGIPRIGGKR